MKGRPTPLRIEVRSADKLLKRGTAWLIGEQTIVTAFHVVGDLDAGQWEHQFDPAAEYVVCAGRTRVTASPLAYDTRDVALLTVNLDELNDVVSASALEWLDEELERESLWDAAGFPQEYAGVLELGGVIRRTEQRKIQLHIAEGAGASIQQEPDGVWRGMSGAAVMQGGWVVGVLTQVLVGRSTAFAAPITVVEDLYFKHVEAAPLLPTEPNFLLGSLQLLYWVLLRPPQWVAYVRHLSRRLPAKFSLAHLSEQQWQDPIIRQLLLRCLAGPTMVLCPFIVLFVLAGLGLFPAGVTEQKLITRHFPLVTLTALFGGFGLSLATGVAAGMAAATVGGLSGALVALYYFFRTEWHTSWTGGIAAGCAVGTAAAVSFYLAWHDKPYLRGRHRPPRRISDLLTYNILTSVAIFFGYAITQSKPVLRLFPPRLLYPLFGLLLGPLLALPLAAAGWLRKRSRSRSRELTQGLSFAFKVMAAFTVLTVFVGAGLARIPDLADQVDHPVVTGSQGLLCGALLSGLFTLTLACVEHWQEKIGSLVAAIAPALVISIVFFVLAAFEHLREQKGPVALALLTGLFIGLALMLLLPRLVSLLYRDSQ